MSPSSNSIPFQLPPVTRASTRHPTLASSPRIARSIFATYSHTASSPQHSAVFASRVFVLDWQVLARCVHLSTINHGLVSSRRGGRRRLRCTCACTCACSCACICTELGYARIRFSEQRRLAPVPAFAGRRCRFCKSTRPEQQLGRQRTETRRVRPRSRNTERRPSDTTLPRYYLTPRSLGGGLLLRPKLTTRVLSPPSCGMFTTLSGALGCSPRRYAIAAFGHFPGFPLASTR